MKKGNNKKAGEILFREESVALRTRNTCKEGGRGRTEVSPKGKKRGFGRLVISAQGVVRRLDILPDTGGQVEPEED